MKSHRPNNAKSRYHQGSFVPANVKKYVGDLNAIFFRSAWELKFMQFCDGNDQVVSWTSEPTGIVYFSPLDKRPHTYYVDFAAVIRDREGVITSWILEVKPEKQLVVPKPPTRLTDKGLESYLHATKQYIINKAKFAAAKDYAASVGFKFGIVTENFIFNRA